MKKEVLRACMVLIAILFLLSGCENLMQDMYDQPKHDPFEKSELFPQGQSARPLMDNTVVHASGGFASSSSGRVGIKKVDISGVNIPFPVTLKILQRGQERYNIYCTPCHGLVGDGDGMVVRRGFPRPPSYHSERLRNVPDGHFYNVMTWGFGRMLSYADRIEPQDRWAIVAYIRALQLSQHTRLADVPKNVRQSLESG